MTSISLSSDWDYTVIYHGDCEVCGRMVACWIRWDRAGSLEVLPSQTAGLRQRFPQMAANYDESLQIIGRDGRVWEGAASFARVFEVLPGGRVFSALLGVTFIRPLAKRLFRWFAANRYRFSCARHCSSPPRKLAPQPGDPRRERRPPS